MKYWKPEYMKKMPRGMAAADGMDILQKKNPI